MPTILHLSQMDAQTMTPPTAQSVMVSIVDAGCVSADLEPGWRAVLRLEFDDVDDAFGDFRVFSWAQALQVVDFLRAHRDADHLISHCHYGYARSASVAMYNAWLHGVTLPAAAEGFNQLVWKKLMLAHALRCLQQALFGAAWRAVNYWRSKKVPIAPATSPRKKR